MIKCLTSHSWFRLGWTVTIKLNLYAKIVALGCIEIGEKFMLVGGGAVISSTKKHIGLVWAVTI